MTAIIIDMNKRDPLTSLERVSLALQYKQPDRVPVAPLVCGASHRVLGITYDRWSQDADLAVQSLLDAQELIGFDAWLTLVDLSVEACDFGQEVIFPRASTAYPNTDNPRIKTVEDYYRLEKVDPLKTKRMRHVIDIVAGLSRAKGQEIAINGFVYGPLGVLSQIRGHERLFKDLIRQPDAVLHAVELITGVLEIYAREQVRAGAHAVVLDPLYSSRSVLSKETWEKFEGPFSKRIADAVRDEGGLVVVHNCGGGVYFDAVIKWISPIAISHAYPAFDCTTWEEHADRWGREVVTIGYSDPANISFLLRPEEVIEDCRKQLETFKNVDHGFILSTGCEFPPNGNLLNARAMVEAAKIYGSN